MWGAILLRTQAAAPRLPIEARPDHNDEGKFVIMAAAEAIPPNVATLSVPETQALADRLYSRSVSALFDASPEVRRDLCMASRAIRSMLHEYDRVASRLEDQAHAIRSLRVDVGGC